MDLILLIMMLFVLIMLLVFYIKSLDDLSLSNWLLICIMLGFITLTGMCILSELGIAYV